MMAASDNDPAGGAAPLETPRPVSKVPRVSPASLAQRKEEPVAGSEVKVNLEDIITLLRKGLSGGGAKPEGAESQQSTLSKEKRKFRRYDPAPPRATEADTGSATPSATDPDAETPAAASAEATTATGASIEGEPAALADFLPRGTRRATSASRRLSLDLVVPAGAVILLLLATFFLGRWTVPSTASAPVKASAPAAAGGEQAAVNLSDASLTAVDQAIAAENAGDFKQASALYEKLENGREHVNGLDYQIGWLDYRTGNSAAAALALNRSIAEGENVSECYGVRGLIRSRRAPDKSLRDFELAAKASPFEADGFFHWGEALRRAGKPGEGLIHLREAVERAASLDDVATYEFKARLAQIELGQDKEFADQLATTLATPKPPMEWVLTAAAEDLHKGNYGAAAGDLNRARQLADPARLASAVGDYFFAGYAGKEPVREILAAIRPSRTVTPLPAVAPAAAAATPDTLLASPISDNLSGSPESLFPAPAATP